MKKIKLAIINLIVIFIFTSTFSLAWPQEQIHIARDNFRKGIFQELNLTTQQQEQLKENRRLQREKNTTLREKIRKKNNQLKQALQNPDLNRNQIEPLTNEIKSLQDQIIDQRVNAILAVKEILTPQQLQKFNQLMENQEKESKDSFKRRRRRD